MGLWLNGFRQLVMAINCLHTYTLDKALKLHDMLPRLCSLQPERIKRKCQNDK